MKRALLVVGNPLRGDDGVAPYLGKLIEKEGLGWKVFYGEDTPESEFNLIREYAPDLIVVADAMTGLHIGSVEIIDIVMIEIICTQHTIFQCLYLLAT